MEGEKQRALPAACGDAARLKGLPESCEEKKWRRCSAEGMPESCEEKKFLLIVTGGRIINQMLCRHGGTGRRAGLKIPFWQQSAGSIPAGGTFTRTLCFQRKWLQTLKIQGFLILFLDETRNNLCTEEQFVRDAFCGKDSSLHAKTIVQG